MTRDHEVSFRTVTRRPGGGVVMSLVPLYRVAYDSTLRHVTIRNSTPLGPYSRAHPARGIYIYIYIYTLGPSVSICAAETNAGSGVWFHADGRALGALFFCIFITLQPRVE